MLITDGTQTALDICARLLAEEKDVVWMEDPGYTAARSVFTVAGLNIQPVAVDASGMTVSDLHDYPAPRFIYLTPSHQYPLGRVAQSDAHNLWERLQQYESAVLLFAKEPHVAFTNNRAERDLRLSKVKQKVSGCFRKRQYAEAYCRISSYPTGMR